MNEDSLSTNQTKKRGSLLRFAGSLQVQLGLFALFGALLPLLVMSIVLSVRVSEQSRNSIREEAFEKLQSIHTIKAQAIKDHLEEQQDNMTVLVKVAQMMRQQTFNQLATMHGNKKIQVESYFAERLDDVNTLAASPGVLEALAALDQVTVTVGGPGWQAIERVYGPRLAEYKQAKAYDDLLLVAADGKVLYSVEQTWLGQDLRADALKDSPISKAFEAGLSALVIQDFAKHELTGDDIVGFVAAPVLDGDETLGVLLVQLSIEPLNALLQKGGKFGESSEIYLVGSDMLFRSDSRFAGESTIINSAYPVITLAVQDALSGESGDGVILDYRNQQTLSIWAPLDISGLQWVIVAQIDQQEILALQAGDEEQDIFAGYRDALGYDDILLVFPDGYVFYSVERQNDYQTNMLTGPYKESNFGRLIAQVLTSQAFSIVDFDVYAPVRDRPAAFMALPVMHEGGVELIVAVRLSLDQINEIMQQDTGLGRTGETYLVGPDRLWRNDSRFLDDPEEDSTILNTSVITNTHAVNEALAGNSSEQATIVENYRGDRVLSAWSPLVVAEADSQNPQGIVWAVVAEIAESEVMEPADKLGADIRQVMIVSFLVVGLLAALLGILIARRMIRPLLRLAQSATLIAGGDWDVELPVVGATNEIGLLANAFRVMIARLRETIQTMQQSGEELTARTVELAERGVELQKVNQQMEQTIYISQRRATMLQASSEVSHAIAQIRDTDQLLPLMTELISKHFGFYHIGIFLIDEVGRYAALRAANSEGGQRMLARGHRLAVGSEGMVGHVTRTGQPRITSDVGVDAVYFDNPDLPETRSEMTLPLFSGDESRRVVGALDVQSKQSAVFGDEDLTVLTTLADQISIAIQNARLFRQSQMALEEAESIYRRHLREEWDSFLGGLPKKKRTGEAKVTRGS